MPDIDSLTQLEKLQARREEAVNELASLVDKREEARSAFEARENSQDAKPSDEERSAEVVAEEEFGKQFDAREREVHSLDRRIREQEAIEQRRQIAAKAASPSISVTSEPLTYRKDNAKETSYFFDLAARYHTGAANKHPDPNGALERLERHAKEMSVEMPKRDAERSRRAQEQIDRAEREFTGSLRGVTARGLDVSPFEQRTNPNRTDGQGGYFVPPLWSIDEYIKYLRAGRVAADLCRGMELPAGTDSINIPKLATPTATGVQTADNASVTSQDLTDTSVSASVKTIAGQQDVAIQLLEQSPGQIMDQVIIEDLMADYNKQIDVQVLTGSGSSGQITGLLPGSNYSNTNTVTWTSATPLGNSFNQALGAAVSKTAYTRYSLENVHALLHPRRWFWFATALDGSSGTSGRPLVNASEFGPFNVSALEVNPTPYQGMVGRTPFGVPVHIDGNVPATATAAGGITTGTNDLGVVAKFDDIWLFEGALRTRVLPEVLSGTLQVRFQVFAYFALLVRYGQSIAVIQGTGMAAPTGAIDTSITF